MSQTLELLERHRDEIDRHQVGWFDTPLPSPMIKPEDTITNLNWCRGNSATVDAEELQTEALNILHYPKAKDRLTWWLDRLSQQLRPGQRLWVVGENHGGIKSLPKRLKGKYEAMKLDAARHCLLFEVSAIAPVTPASQWQSFTTDHDLTCFALPGVFSAGRLDTGTDVLLNVLPELKGNILEFGGGCGVLTAFLARQESVKKVDAVEIDLLAVRSSQKTLRENNLDTKATTHWSAGMEMLEPRQFDAIVTNPPFHQGLRTAYAPTETFFSEAHRWLRKGGDLIWVVNDFLHYEQQLDSSFSKPRVLARERGFKVMISTRH